MVSLPSGKARTTQYVPVRQLTGTQTGRYRAVPLKSVVDGRLREKSTVGGRLRKKREEEEEEEEEKKKEEEEEKKKYLARAPSPPVSCPCTLVALATRGRLFSPHGETERLLRGERDRGDTLKFLRSFLHNIRSLILLQL
ncbi:hypothetical protein GW17_00049948 [Ensete ventricosum]|nr:hypothetical protein GW17_00049948 [Ensete ventricosum]